MNTYYILVFLIILSAAFSYINYRYIKMPFVIGIFFLSTLLSLLVLSGRYWDIQHYTAFREKLTGTYISKFILEILLGFLLFAGSLHTNWMQIKNQIKSIGIFALAGVIFSTLFIGGMFYGICFIVGEPIRFIYCLIFGALISPTDPIAVLGILTKAKVSKKIEATIVGESLFNDGVGVVLFIALLETLKSGNEQIDFAHFGILFFQEAVGGILFGLAFGYTLYLLLKSINNYETEVLLTLAFVMGGFLLCSYFHFSGALAMVIMGLLVGNYKTHTAMSDTTQVYMHKFWELVDVILNAVLFILIAFVLVLVDFKNTYLVIGLLSVLIVLISRVIVIYFPTLLFPKFTNLTVKESKLIVWGGLRGGLSIALVLSLPESSSKDLLMLATYICVVFSILVQGLSIEKLAKSIEDN